MNAVLLLIVASRRKMEAGRRVIAMTYEHEISEFCQFNCEHLDAYRAWFLDAELRRRIAYPTDEWFAYVEQEEASCWAVLTPDQGLLAVIQVDKTENGIGYFAFALNPSFRRRGSGSRVLEAFVKGPGLGYVKLVANVEMDNLPSIRSFRRAGFEHRPEHDVDGMLSLEFEP